MIGIIRDRLETRRWARRTVGRDLACFQYGVGPPTKRRQRIAMQQLVQAGHGWDEAEAIVRQMDAKRLSAS